MAWSQTSVGTLADVGPAATGEGLEPGDHLGRYIVLERIGEGGMGVVYCAFDPELNRKVAVKLVRVHARRDDERSNGATRLLREAQVMARLAHPNVVTVHDVGTFGDAIFVAMEFIEGETLVAWARERERSWTEILAVYLQAGRGLEAAHALGLVHRDFKPENVMIGAGRVRVLDFGLARQQDDPHEDDDEPDAPPGERVRERQSTAPEPEALDPGGSNASTPWSRGGSVERVRSKTGSTDAIATPLTQVGAVLGTPAYMAPEQHLGLRADPRTDQFSFCVSLYKALYAAHPFAAKNLTELTMKVLDGEVEAPPVTSPVPPHVRDAILRGLAVDPDARWPSMGDLLAELDRDPGTRRRQKLVALGLGLGFVGLFTGVVLAAEPQPEPCSGAGDQLAEVWNPDSRAAVERALLATERGYASETWARVEASLDAYADDWIAGHVDACEATRVRQDQSEQLLDDRMRCLADRRRALAAVVDTLAHADADTLPHAITAVAALPSVDPCADLDYVTASLAPPEPALVADVDATRDQLAAAKAAHDSGRYPAGLAFAEQADADAERLGYAPLEAEAALHLGTLARASGDYPRAEQALRRAFFVARRVGHDEVSARAGVGLIALLGEGLRRTDEGVWWSDHAGVELERRPDPAVEAELASNLGALWFAAGDFEQAQVHYLDALERRRRLHGPDHVEVGFAHDDLGRVAYRRGDDEQAIVHHQHALALLERALGDDHPELAEPLTNLANVRLRQKRLDEAQTLYERALSIRERGLGPTHVGVGIALNNLGNVHDARADYATALDVYTRALAILEAALGPDHPDLAATLANAGNCHESLGQLDEALAVHRRALAIKQAALGPDHHSLGYSHNGLGNVLFGLGEYAQAVDEYAQSVAIWERALGRDHRLLNYPLRGQGKALVELGRHADAVAPLERARDLLLAHSAPAEDVATPSFWLARALAEGGLDRERAASLAREALAAYEAADELEHAEEVRAWLERRPALSR